jgi:iron complex outermembrane receptor protein
MKIYLSVYIIFTLLISAEGWPQVKLSGKITDQKSGETLISVNIYFPELQRGTITDASGYYEFTNLPGGYFQIQFSYVGYKSQVVPIELKKENVVLNVAMVPSEVEIGEVVVLGNLINEIEKAPYKIERVSTDEIRKDGFISLQRSLTLLPGVSELSNGFSISKPVIRGLFGYRIAAIVNGLRFDNQEWQNEHGFGVNEVGIGSVEIIEGPAALLYGANVIGGAVNFVDPQFAPVGKTLGEASLETFSNTLGANAIFGVKGSGQSLRWQLYVGGQSHADYLDGEDERVPNTRFAGLDGKGILNYNSDWGYSNLEYFFSHHIHGVVEETELENESEMEEEHFEREFEGPHHTIDFHVISLKNLFLSGESKFKVNLGFQNNHRVEEEGDEEENMEINKALQEEKENELDVILNTLSYDAEWIYPVFSQAELTLGTQGQIQSNENEGGRILVPNADMNEFSGFAYLKKNFDKFLFEGGFRYDVKTIETEEMGEDIAGVGEEEEGYFEKVDRDFNTVNGAIGGTFFPNDNWIIKLNFATGFRAPNLAELSSNGVHEGTTRYEVGNPDMENEQNYQVDLGITIVTNIAKISLNGFNNHINNFIYLMPTGEMIEEYDEYKFVQTDADLRGGEISIDLKPSDWVDFNASYSTVIGKEENDDYLPFMPADKIIAGAVFFLPDGGFFKSNMFNVRVRTYLEQTRTAENETNTDGYTLLDAGVGTQIDVGAPLNVALNVTNVLGEQYINHLSLLKPLGIHDMGRNISLSLNLPFDFN